jgi:hypothetical protein
MEFEWKALNTALVLAALGFLWNQSKKIDTIYQALFGVDGKNGMSSRIKALEDGVEVTDGSIETTRHTLRNEFQHVIAEFHEDIEKRLDKKQDRRTR